MKFQVLITAAVVLAMAACKTPYKATDRPTTTTDSTASVTDTTSAMNKMLVSTDSAMSKIDSTNKSLPDSAKVSSPMDTTQAKPAIDSVRATPDSVKATPQPDSVKATTTQPDSIKATPQPDSTKMQSATDSMKATPAIDSTAKSMEAPAAVEAVFTKQYPGATNVVWSAYDSLAAVPIDMRLTGWKKLDGEDYLVKFDLKDEPYYAWYDSKGKWIGSASPLEDITKLPAAVTTAVNNAIKTRYAGYKVSQVNREFQTGKKSYEVELTKEDDAKVRMMVTSAGKISQIFKYAAEKKE